MRIYNYEPCAWSERTALAVMDTDKREYFCQQGDETWTQRTCVGWAICEPVYTWVANKADDLNGSMVPVKQKEPKPYE